MTSLRLLILALGAVGAAAASAARADAPVAGSVPPPVGGFLDTYCIDCHRGAKPKGSFSIEALKADFADPKALDQWVRVFDKASGGQMPPKDADQPAAEERRAAVESLGRTLHQASLARQQAEGRVVIRRLNRTEYENTLHDLLGVVTPLKDLLPEDNAVGGFDNVASGLEISATHLVRYQQAADRALADALPLRPAASTTKRMTGREYIETRHPSAHPGILPYVRVDGDTLMNFAAMYKHGWIHADPTPAAGRYRFRASVRAVNTPNGASLPVMCGKTSSNRFDEEKLKQVLHVQDAPADRSVVIEFESDQPEGEQIFLWAWQGLPSMDEFRKANGDQPPGPDFKGPALAVEWVELEGPLDAGRGTRLMFGDLPLAPRRFVPDLLAGKDVGYDWGKLWNVGEYTKFENNLVPMSKDPRADAERLIRAFLPRAFRRPVSDATADYFVRFVHAQLDRGEPFDAALRAGYKAVLCSPFFLFMVERPGPLDGYAVASRLSYFFWGSMPDDELTALAAGGRLRDPAVLDAQVERMLAHPRARRFTTNFTGQWLELRKFFDMKPDPLYVEYDDFLAYSMPQETVRFFDEVLRGDLPVTSFVHSDWTMLNDRLARHYGIPGVAGMDFRKVTLPPGSHRGGLMTHASVLKLTTNATYTSPIKRGTWVLDRLVGKPPSPPPPDVGAIEPDVRGATTIREQLAMHQSVSACATCHVHIDPPGFALESFDVLGGWREAYRTKEGPPNGGSRYEPLPNYPDKKVWLARPVEPGATTADGEAFADVDGYKKVLLKDPDQIARNMAQKLITYGTGATMQFADREAVEQIVAASRAKGYGFRSLIHEVVKSRVFLCK